MKDKNDNYKISVMDNGSTPENMSQFTEYTLPNNVYYGGGLSCAFELFLEEGDEFDSLLFMNNDLIVGRRFVQTLQEDMEQNDLTMLSPCFFNVEPDKPCHWKNMLNWGSKEIRLCKWIDFQSPMIHRRLIEKLKTIDPMLYMGWGIDLHTGITCEQNGWKVAVSDRVSMLHFNSLTIKRGVAGLNTSQYCMRAEEGQRAFFVKMNLMDKFNEFRQLMENYNYSK